MLLDHGADVDRAGPNKWVARYKTALFDNQETLRLLDHVCSPSTCNKCATAEGRAKDENETIFASALHNLRLDEMNRDSGSSGFHHDKGC